MARCVHFGTIDLATLRIFKVGIEKKQFAAQEITARLRHFKRIAISDSSTEKYWALRIRIL